MKTLNIRNICILAHVDHGKTSLSDSLVASNGIIPSRSAGRLRYLDSRPDEQERGITIKSSAIALFFEHVTRSGLCNSYRINLVDSPGHIDFAAEVAAAARLSDGALVLVDVVEGVATQTLSVLKHAWKENIKPLLVFNKMDKLITILKMTPEHAYVHLAQILDQVNALTASMFTQQRIIEDEARRQSLQDNEDDDWHLEEKDDSHLYFSPEFGNVIFASATDGWAFRPEQFAQMYAARLGVNPEKLARVMWGDWFLDPRSKRVVGPKAAKKHASDKSPLKPLFVQFCLENIWAVYRAVQANDSRVRLNQIVGRLGLKNVDTRSRDTNTVIQSVMSAWIPVSTAVLLAVVDKLPSPVDAQPIRMPDIIGVGMPENMTQAVMDCNPAADVPVVGYISKILNVPTDQISQRKPSVRQQSAEQIKARRQEYIAALKLKQERGEFEQKQASMEGGAVPELLPDPIEEASSETLIGFARLYSGTLKVGDKIFLLGPKYDPRKPEEFSHEITITGLYLLMGRELESLDHVTAGNVFGMSGLEDSGILKTATMSSSRACPSLGSLRLAAPPILRVAVEPRDPRIVPFNL